MAPEHDRPHDREQNPHRQTDPPKPRLKARRKYEQQQRIASDEREATEQLGETGEQYSHDEERDPASEMTEGQDLGMTNPDVVSESPGGMGEDDPSNIHRGFANDRERRD